MDETELVLRSETHSTSGQKDFDTNEFGTVQRIDDIDLDSSNGVVHETVFE